ncbi:nucleoside monophosphate kinase [Candidatus Woesearchaeota archaeon]|nr:nucleoside monophosphate kinase [Candidatus Woesearchaeota archaeon]MBT4368625.1 nucleoside monophosphate kinase [Candidatus Woesearchaeota archaeon]MBT4713066.1 nucleoside monophosphate kinase [Candidatus Woesearchaeota archaeon]MBT6638988.1 nucleoside monophosphate kinase [Candidatus Woesearchaeota archaeon]MBT7134187.1 nucleoside monophosphate kinase [Candidatus Woesearchaeota archaeon]
MKTVIFIGAPGVGKGTYTSKIVDKYGWFHVSPGELLRENVREKTELGNKIAAVMQSGDLIDDDLVIGVIKNAIEGKDSVLFDGFPRTVYQAEKLDDFAKPSLIINFVADEEKIVERLSGRRVCPECEAIFHVKNIPSKVEGVCDKCSGALVQRKDDLPEAIKERLRVFHELTQPVVEFYREREEFKVVDANSDDVDSIVENTMNIINVDQ